MKKLITVLALALMTVVMAFTVAGCGNTSSTSMKEDVDSLKSEIEKLKEDIKNLNVFWTDKAEYSETETMTVYFGQKAVFKIRINFDNLYTTALSWSGKTVLNNSMYITSLCSDIYSDSIVATSFVAWDNGTCVRNQSTSVNILKKNVETSVGGNYQASNDVYNNATRYDLVICVPGTPFELARFKNVSFNLN